MSDLLGITAETKREHRMSWFVYTGGRNGDGTPERIPWQSTMRGTWPGFDAVCKCGQWESKTGGAVRSAVREAVEDHWFDVQSATEREADTRTPDERLRAAIAELLGDVTEDDES